MNKGRVWLGGWHYERGLILYILFCCNTAVSHDTKRHTYLLHEMSSIVIRLKPFLCSLCLRSIARRQTRRNYDGPSSCREAPAGDLKNRSTTAAATSGATSLSATSAAATPMSTTWVWHPPSEPPQPGDRKPQQQRQQQQQRGETEAFRVVTARDGNDEEGTLGGDTIDNNKMFAKARPASFQSSCRYVKRADLYHKVTNRPTDNHEVPRNQP